MNIAGIFEEAAMRWPERTAIIDKDGRRYSFSELRSLIMLQAGIFKRKGIAPGDRVMVFVPMSVELYVAVLALFYIGASAVFLDEWVSRERMELCCRMAHCKGLVASWKVRIFALQSAELRKVRHWFSLPEKKLKGRINEMALFPSGDDETALITFTTGSTGTPKAANRTHAFLKAQFDALMPLTEPLPGYPEGPDMPMLPIVLLLNLGRGTTSVIADFKATKPLAFLPEKVWTQIEKYKVVSLTTSPFYAGKLADHVKGNNSTLRRVLIGGAAVFPHLIEKINAQFPAIQTVVIYGSTEAEPVSHISGNELLLFHKGQALANGLLVGTPDASAKVELIPLSYLPGQPFEPIAEAGQIGEICVSGRHVLKGYIANKEAERQNKIWVGDVCWHRTGDAGALDDKGRLFLFGRVQQIIRHKDKIWHPFLVECFLQNLHGVICGTVMLKNEKLWVVLQSGKGFDKTSAEKEIHLHLPDAHIVYIKEIPLDPRHHSKIDYEKLSAIL